MDNEFLVNVDGGKITVPNTDARTIIVSMTAMHLFFLESIELAGTNTADTFGFLRWHLTLNGIDAYPYINRRAANIFNNAMNIPVRWAIPPLTVVQLIGQLTGAAGVVDVVGRLTGYYIYKRQPGFTHHNFRDNRF